MVCYDQNLPFFLHKLLLAIAGHLNLHGNKLTLLVRMRQGQLFDRYTNKAIVKLHSFLPNMTLPVQQVVGDALFELFHKFYVSVQFLSGKTSQSVFKLSLMLSL